MWNKTNIEISLLAISTQEKLLVSISLSKLANKRHTKEIQ